MSPFINTSIMTGSKRVVRCTVMALIIIMATMFRCRAVVLDLRLVAETQAQQRITKA